MSMIFEYSYNFNIQ